MLSVILSKKERAFTYFSNVLRENVKKTITTLNRAQNSEAPQQWKERTAEQFHNIFFLSKSFMSREIRNCKRQVNYTIYDPSTCISFLSSMNYSLYSQSNSNYKHNMKTSSG